MYRSRILVMTFAVVVLLTVLPDPAFAARSCTIVPASTPAERAELWTKALEAFTVQHPALTAEQTQFLGEALDLGNDIATPRQDERAQAAFIRKATRLRERAEELFSNNELGALFTSMGETQIWLAQVAQAVPYCNCVGPGPCTVPNGTIGNCAAGCLTWDHNGTRINGICSVASTTPTDPQEP